MASSSGPAASSSTSALRGIACVVMRSWNAGELNVELPKGLSPSLNVEQGDCVWVFHINQGYGYTRLHRQKSQTSGSLPCLLPLLSLYLTAITQDGCP